MTLEIALELRLFARAGGAQSVIFADFINTIEFAPNVFELPDGFTVNSVGAEITNNQGSNQPTAVPEPSTLTLMAIGMTGLLCIRCRKRRQLTSRLRE